MCWRFGAALLQANACNTDTTQTQPHQISNTQRTENKTTDVVIQQHSRKLLMMDILMSEIYWVHKKWYKIASDIKLVFYSSIITMMHGPMNIRFDNMTFNFDRAIQLWAVGVNGYKSRSIIASKRQAMYVQSNIEAPSCNRCCSGKAVGIAQLQCMYL